MSFWLKQSITRIRVRPPNLDDLQNQKPNPAHVEVMIRGLAGEQDPILIPLYENRLATLLDALVSEHLFNRLSPEELRLLVGMRNQRSARLTQAIEHFYYRFS